MFIKVEVWTVGRTDNGIAVLLRLPASPQCVPIYVESHTAQKVLAALAGNRNNMPEYPEFFISLAKALKVKPDSMEILGSGIPGEYNAVIHFVEKESRFSLDINVSEALPLALRASIPIFIEASISEENGITVSMEEGKLPLASQISRLQGELARQIEIEDYEKAAKTRDRIKYLEEQIRSKRE